MLQCQVSGAMEGFQMKSASSFNARLRGAEVLFSSKEVGTVGKMEMEFGEAHHELGIRACAKFMASAKSMAHD